MLPNESKHCQFVKEMLTLSSGKYIFRLNFNRLKSGSTKIAMQAIYRGNYNFNWSNGSGAMSAYR